MVFNLYLLRSGFSTGFVGLFLMVDMLFHGLVAFPAGMIADRIGRRKAFFFATCLNLVARGSLLFTTDPGTLLVLAALAGTGEAFHGSAGPPFIMENSRPQERPLLFSMHAIFHLISRSVGSALPLVWAVTLGVPDLNIGMARWLLVLSLPLTLVALAPLWFMTERRDNLAGSFMDLITLRNVVNFPAIAKLALCNVMVGLGMGLATRFFNVFFDLGMGATDRQLSAVFAVAALAGATAVLFSGMLVRRWGTVRSIAITQLASVPFLLLMIFVPLVIPGLPLVVIFFILRDALYSISNPVRSQLAMEMTVARERGTTAGLTHMSFDLGGAFGAGLAGALIGISAAEASLGVEVARFVPAFTVAALLVVVGAGLYYFFFRNWDERRSQVEELAQEPALRPQPGD
ncbi:MAG: hypothetical protein BZY88_01340 [SAR202 cluster bacterium Io17-Chloro-G9]|nr:MAG: hypothetical protein BZY88_01340 [SAR202 cluster bacterium Io17-Chloro-G9]